MELDYSATLGHGVCAFSSDRAIDFHRGDPARADRFVLTLSQQEWLRSRGVSDPETVVFPQQVHGDAVWQVTAREAGLRGSRAADAVVTQEPGLPVAVRTADCLPIFLFDPVAEVIAAVHAGWKSTRLEIAVKTVEVMRTAYGVHPGDLRAILGPCIRCESYQVGPEFHEYFPDEVIETPRGFCLDLAAANIRQLLRAGLNRDHITDCGRCTFSEGHRFFSFRREGEAAGRMINLIMLDK